MNPYPVLIFDPTDNVATAVKTLPPNTPVADGLKTREEIPFAYKVALRNMKKGEMIRKYGISIGCALKDISAGACVHIHNVGSLCDRRSVGFEAESAAPQDMCYTLEEVDGDV